MDLSRAVLMPIDMQQAFEGPSWRSRWNTDLDKNGLRLLSHWRAHGRPIIHVRHDSVVPGSDFRPGAPGNAFRPGFEPQAGEGLVVKSVNAAFIGTDLELRLRRLGADTVVAFGFSTDQCVSSTVRVGSNLGYKMVVVADACDCFDLPDPRGGIVPAATIHAAHLATLAFDFATAVSTEDVLGTALTQAAA